MRLRSIIGIPLALSLMLFSVTIMTIWWQILFSQTLESYIPARIYEMERQLRLELSAHGSSILLNHPLLEPSSKCSQLLCLESGSMIYQLRQSVMESLEAEKQSKKRLFLSESVFLISVLILSAVYMLVLMKREKRRLEEREQFLAMATHELKHPISALSLLLESLRRGSLPAEQQERFIERGLAELHNLKQQSDNLLKVQQLSRLSQPEKSPYLLVPLLRELIERSEERRRQKERCHLQITDEQLKTKANRQGLALIMDNLLDNALVYSEKIVTITVGGSGRYIRVDIADQGLGFTEEEKRNLGRMFFRSQRHQIQNIRGSGLGLFTVMRLVSLMKIKLKLHSEGPQLGSCFSLYIKKAND